MSDPMHTQVAIIGSGPAAHTCAIYAGRALLEPIMFEGFLAYGVASGGQLTTTTDVENYPGFPEGILGPTLMERMRDQSIKCGTSIMSETISEVDFSQKPFILKTESGDTFTADAVVIATGATAKRLRLPGEETYWQKGVSACAVCDGALPIFRNKPLVVIGGGDSASEESNFLSKYGSKIYVLVRKPKGHLRASATMTKRMEENPKIEILYNTVAKELKGDDLLREVVIEDVVTKERRSLEVAGLFYAIGHEPNTDIFKGQLELDPNGYIITAGKSTITNVPGVFACGDVQDHRYRQAITAAGTGCMAALDAEKYLDVVNN